jgi:hypothetical protein
MILSVMVIVQPLGNSSRFMQMGERALFIFTVVLKLSDLLLFILVYPLPEKHFALFFPLPPVGEGVKPLLTYLPFGRGCEASVDVHKGAVDTLALWERDKESETLFRERANQKQE